MLNFSRQVKFDGSMGNLLTQRGKLAEPDLYVLTDPDLIRGIHTEYVEAGAEVITTDTFGLNRLRYPNIDVPAAARRAEKLARDAGAKYVALDIGPVGQLLKPMGTLGFGECVSLFAEVIRGTAADLVLIETMSDLYELKAAVLAAKENCNLPVVATVTLDENGRLLTGADLRCAAALLEGLRVDALGINCSREPSAIYPFVRELCGITSLPVAVQPNAGLPDPFGAHKLSRFAEDMKKIAEIPGVWGIGGCCGTTPEDIRQLQIGKYIAKSPDCCENIVCSGSVSADFDRFVLIGERLNPTGKKKLKDALVAGDFAYVKREAAAQEQSGADMLDLNAGVPSIDEPKTLAEMVAAAQSVSSLPLCLDSSDPLALEAALRICNGVALINSVNGKQSSMDAVFPLAAKYGGMVVALCLDDGGIPQTARERAAIAEKIADEAMKYGIARSRLIADALTLPVSADKNAARVTLETVALLTARGFKTVLGASNISFGLPNRDALTAAFLQKALQAGLSAAILNPASQPVAQAIAAHGALGGDFDPWIGAFSEVDEKSAVKGERTLGECIVAGLADDCQTLCAAGDPLELIDREIIPALKIVGDNFERGKIFLPQLLRSADAAKTAFAALEKRLPDNASAKKETIVVATVKGDIHDIGKNIAATLMSTYGYNVIDLGKDVAPEAVCDAVIKSGARFAGLSALMTTTVPAMKETIARLRERAPGCRVIVSGAVMSDEYAAFVGADKYVPDAFAAMRWMEGTQ